MITTTDINIACLLMAAGIPIAKPAEIRATHKGETKYFFFKQTKEAQELVEKWIDPDFIQEHPDDPVALVKAFANCRKGIFDGLSRFKRVVYVEHNGKVAVLPSTASKDDVGRLMGRLYS